MSNIKRGDVFHDDAMLRARLVKLYARLRAIKRLPLEQQREPLSKLGEDVQLLETLGELIVLFEP